MTGSGSPTLLVKKNRKEANYLNLAKKKRKIFVGWGEGRYATLVDPRP